MKGFIVCDLDPIVFELKKGKTYSLSKQTPLMPEFEPKDGLSALDAMTKIMQLFPGVNFTVIKIKYKRNYPWYKVYCNNKKPRLEGWLNSIALVGQEIKEIR